MLRLALLAAAALLAGCARPDDDGPRHPPGTVLVVAGTPFTAAEIDAVADAIAPLSPSFTRPHLRRIALTASLFPLATGRRLAGEARAQALAAARDFRAQVEAGAQGPLPAPEEGGYKYFGIETWIELTRLEPGEWSAVFEAPGEFVVVRLRERTEAPHPAAQGFVADVMRFPYEDSRGEIDQAVYEQELEILDPEWERVVPAQWRIPMSEGR